MFVDVRCVIYSFLNYFFGISGVILTCVVKMPRICCGRHWWDGERWGPTVRLHQFALVRHSRGGCGLSVRLSGCRRGRGLCSASQCRLEGRDSVELYPRQTADEAWGVVPLDEEWVYVSSLCAETQGGREAGITGVLWCFVICLMRPVKCDIKWNHACTYNWYWGELGETERVQGESREPKHWP